MSEPSSIRNSSLGPIVPIRYLRILLLPASKTSDRKDIETIGRIYPQKGTFHARSLLRGGISLAKKTVVVADDQPGIRRLLSEVLNSDEYALLEAASGEEAMEMIRERTVDLVFLDVRMPRLDGVETLREIMQLYAHPPVIVITGQGSPDLAKRVKKLGAAAYLEKP
ncbi:MAG TPA: hypothetical protein DEA85_02025, partial [Firmicutes bacterium]|nr:hypothetical protein [Bacillota bacterium]